jgi:hypothetical protein
MILPICDRLSAHISILTNEHCLWGQKKTKLENAHQSVKMLHLYLLSKEVISGQFLAGPMPVSETGFKCIVKYTEQAFVVLGHTNLPG